MNRIFKAVWNESSGTWVAASETAGGKTKRKSSLGSLVAACAVVAGGMAAGSAQAQWTTGSGPVSLQGGSSANATGIYTVAIGTNTLAEQDWSTAVGVSATASGEGATAYGQQAKATADSAVAVGRGGERRRRG